MRGYLVNHHSKLWDGIRADIYRNDPYVWADPYLWTFCHTNQRPRVDAGMTVLWMSKDEDAKYVCDLVFVVGEVLPFHEALSRFRTRDRGIALDHFLPGIEYHFDYVRQTYARTFVADMSRSFIPQPAVELEIEIDLVRNQERPGCKPLRKAWGRQTTPLVINDPSPLLDAVTSRAARQISGALPAGDWIPGQGPVLK
jgi:hypothetical protein